MSLVFITFLITIGTILCALIAQYLWSRRHLYAAARTFSGPPALPIIGNALQFICKNEDILQKLYENINAYESPMRFWLGPKLLLMFSNPNHVEKIMSSSKFAHKHEIYDFIKPFLGEGLVSGSGQVYRMHRRIIQPMFSMKFCCDNLDVFQKHADECVEKLAQYVDGGETFDIQKIMHKCYANTVGETVLGVNMKAYENTNKDFVQATIDMYDYGFTRLIKPWLHPDIIFNKTAYKTFGDKMYNHIYEFIEQTIIESWTRRKLSVPTKTADNLPIIDQIADHIEQNPNSISSVDFASHMTTLYAASEDTMTIVSSCVCTCLGMYPEYQKKVADEIREVFGETPRKVLIEDIGKLVYLDMCIKDVLRLVPIAPYVLRRVIEDYQLDNKWTIPKGSGIVIPIYNLHRDPAAWENPHHFHPDHFLPEAVRKRHVYSYVPFSAGPRSCIGKIFANVALKTYLATILQQYEFEADGKFPDFKLKMDISTRPMHGYKARLRKRTWK